MSLLQIPPCMCAHAITKGVSALSLCMILQCPLQDKEEYLLLCFTEASAQISLLINTAGITDVTPRKLQQKLLQLLYTLINMPFIAHRKS